MSKRSYAIVALLMVAVFVAGFFMARLTKPTSLGKDVDLYELYDTVEKKYDISLSDLDSVIQDKTFHERGFDCQATCNTGDMQFLRLDEEPLEYQNYSFIIAEFSDDGMSKNYYITDDVELMSKIHDMHANGEDINADLQFSSIPLAHNRNLDEKYSELADLYINQHIISILAQSLVMDNYLWGNVDILRLLNDCLNKDDTLNKAYGLKSNHYDDLKDAAFDFKEYILSEEKCNIYMLTDISA